MRLALLLLAIVAAPGLAAAAAQPGYDPADEPGYPPAYEDAAHRADRLRTAELNRAAAARTARRDARAAPAGSPSAADARAYRAARNRYEQAMADWRARVAACDAGDWSACR